MSFPTDVLFKIVISSTVTSPFIDIPTTFPLNITSPLKVDSPSNDDDPSTHKSSVLNFASTFTFP